MSKRIEEISWVAVLVRWDAGKWLRENILKVKKREF